MAINELTVTKSISAISSKSEKTPALRSYVESAPLGDPASMDVLRQFQANMKTLEDLGGRLRFMMTEIKGLIRK